MSTAMSAAVPAPVPPERFEDWPARLAELIEARRHMPFAWGTQDCCAFAAAAVQAQRGDDPLAQHVYADERAALRRLAALGGIRAACTAALGPEIAAAFAQRGDVVLIEIDGRQSVAVCLGRDCAGAGPDGLTWVPMREALCGWRV